MEMPFYKVGERIEKLCTVCNQQLVHIVKSTTKLGKISRVKCPKCGLVGAFKVATELIKIEDLANKTGPVYDRSRTYRTGQFMSHPSFGQGVVMTVFDTKTIDVMFLDRVRRLIHSR